MRLCLQEHLSHFGEVFIVENRNKGTMITHLAQFQVYLSFSEECLQFIFFLKTILSGIISIVCLQFLFITARDSTRKVTVRWKGKGMTS